MRSYWLPVLLALITAALVGSVVVPAGETAHVLELVDDVDRVIEPARLDVNRLESGIADESAELQRYAVAGDTAALNRFRAAAAEDERQLADLHRLGAELGSAAADDVSVMGRHVQRWRTLAVRELTSRRSIAAFVETADERQALRDSIVLAASQLQSGLAADAARRRAALASHERMGLFINAALVVVALFTIGIGFELWRRERQRARREAALRMAAEALAGAFTTHDVTDRLGHCAMELLEASGACVGHVDVTGESGRVIMAMATNEDAASWNVDGPFRESLVERAIEGGGPMLVAHDVTESSGLGWKLRRRWHLVVVPIGTPAAPIGAVVVRESHARRFRRSDLAWAGILGHLASLAYEKVRLLQEARDGRARLERAMESRGRLMRGFSHDVKNPLGAALGYVSLLEDGIYGSLTDAQGSAVARVLSAIQRALTLIDDLHELARAETGNLLVHVGPTDLTELLHVIGDEYRAAAATKQLRFGLEIEPELPVVQTDASRIRQIVANLLSNAIKYTREGSIALHAWSDAGAPPESEPCVHVEVADTGPGIPLDQRDLIFEEFRRGGGAGGDEQSGAGLGLAISRGVADALGCRIQVESEIGKGSRFTLRIPLVAPPALQEPGGQVAEAPTVTR